MKAKDYLRQVKKIDNMITNKIIEKEQWMAIATSTTAASDGERVQSSGSQQKMADAVLRMVEIEDEINTYIDRLIDTKKDVIATIEKLPATEYDILHKMYIGRIVRKNGNHITEYMSLYDVADSKGRTYSWATTVHGRALKNIQDILDERGCENESNAKI